MQDRNGPGGGHGIEVARDERRALEEDRVVAPGQQRLGVAGHALLSLAQALQHGGRRLQPFPQVSIGAAPVVVTHVDGIPHRALHEVAVPLHQSGHQHLVAQCVDRCRVGPAPHVLQIADGQDAAVAHGHVRRNRLRRVHRQDLAGDVDANVVAAGCGVVSVCHHDFL